MGICYSKQFLNHENGDVQTTKKLSGSFNHKYNSGENQKISSDQKKNKYLQKENYSSQQYYSSSSNNKEVNFHKQKQVNTDTEQNFLAEESISQKELSYLVHSPYNKYPQKCIGRIVSCFYDLQIEKQIDLPFGTGCLIHPRIVLTAAHNMYSKVLKKIADQVFFQLQVQGQSNGPLIKVKRYAIHQNYFNEKDSMSQNYDLAILILQQNSHINSSQYLKMQLNYTYSQKSPNNIFISGYPKDKNIYNTKFMQYQGQLNLSGFKNNFLMYKYFMGGGYSGCPIIKKEIYQNGQTQFRVIGVHKGALGTKAYGVILNFQQNQLFLILKAFNGRQSIQQKNSMLTELESMLEQLETKTQDIDQAFFNVNKLRWSKKVEKYYQISYFINHDENENSYMKVFQLLTQNLSNFIDSELILKKSVWDFIFNRFKHLKLSQEQQTKLFQFFIDMFQVNCGKKYISNQTQYISNTCKNLHIFQNFIYFKTKSYLLKNKITYSNILSQKVIQLRDRMLLVLKNDIDLQLKWRRKQQQKNQRQIMFYTHYHQYKKAKEYVQAMEQQKQDYNQQKEIKNKFLQQNSYEQIFLNGQVMFLNYKFQQALKYFMKYLEKMKQLKMNKNISHNNDDKQYKIKIAKVNNYIGMIYYYKNQMDSALQYYRESLELRQTLYGIQSKEYANTLNQIGMVYEKQQNYQEALKVLMESLSIMKKFNNGMNVSVPSIYYNLGMIYKKLGQQENAIYYYKKTLQIHQIIFGERAIQSLRTINNYGEVYLSQENYQQALSCFLTCQQILNRNKNQKDALNTLLVYRNFASVYYNQGKLTQAIGYLKKSYQFSCKIYGKQHEYTLSYEQGYKKMLEQRQKQLKD